MTKQKTFKRRVRERMAKTGESYTAARRMLIAKGDRPDANASTFEPTVSESKLVETTGQGWDEWLSLLDGWGAVDRPHREIARWLIDEHGVPGWYAQAITVGFERARGLRSPGQRKDGWEATASKTVGVPVERLFAAFEDEATRDRWLPGVDMRLRSATPSKTIRCDWEDGSTRVVFWFESVGADKSRVSLAHQRLPDADTADEMKTWWRERVASLKSLLES